MSSGEHFGWRIDHHFLVDLLEHPVFRQVLSAPLSCRLSTASPNPTCPCSYLNSDILSPGKNILGPNVWCDSWFHDKYDIVSTTGTHENIVPEPVNLCKACDESLCLCGTINKVDISSSSSSGYSKISSTNASNIDDNIIDTYDSIGMTMNDDNCDKVCNNDNNCNYAIGENSSILSSDVNRNDETKEASSDNAYNVCDAGPDTGAKIHPVSSVESSSEVVFDASAAQTSNSSSLMAFSSPTKPFERSRRVINTPGSRMSLGEILHKMSKSNINQHLLIPALEYGDPAIMSSVHEQPFEVKVHPQVGLLTDFHSHLCDAEIIGLLAGKWDIATKRLYIQAAFPCTSTDRTDDDGSTDVELDPVAEWKVREVISQLGLVVVGWYHSHPKFAPDPSVTDVNNQSQYQHLMRDHNSEYEPFVGLIVSTFDNKSPTANSRHQWFHVRQHAVDSRTYYIPMRIHVNYRQYRNENSTIPLHCPAELSALMQEAIISYASADASENNNCDNDRGNIGSSSSSSSGEGGGGGGSNMNGISRDDNNMSGYGNGTDNDGCNFVKSGYTGTDTDTIPGSGTMELDLGIRERTMRKYDSDDSEGDEVENKRSDEDEIRIDSDSDSSNESDNYASDHESESSEIENELENELDENMSTELQSDNELENDHISESQSGDDLENKKAKTESLPDNKLENSDVTESESMGSMISFPLRGGGGEKYINDVDDFDSAHNYRNYDTDGDGVGGDRNNEEDYGGHDNNNNNNNNNNDNNDNNNNNNNNNSNSDSNSSNNNDIGGNDATSRDEGVRCDYNDNNSCIGNDKSYDGTISNSNNYDSISNNSGGDIDSNSMITNTDKFPQNETNRSQSMNQNDNDMSCNFGIAPFESIEMDSSIGNNDNSSSNSVATSYNSSNADSRSSKIDAKANKRKHIELLISEAFAAVPSMSKRVSVKPTKFTNFNGMNVYDDPKFKSVIESDPNLQEKMKKKFIRISDATRILNNSSISSSSSSFNLSHVPSKSDNNKIGDRGKPEIEKAKDNISSSNSANSTAVATSRRKSENYKADNSSSSKAESHTAVITTRSKSENFKADNSSGNKAESYTAVVTSSSKSESHTAGNLSSSKAESHTAGNLSSKAESHTAGNLSISKAESRTAGNLSSSKAESHTAGNLSSSTAENYEADNLSSKAESHTAGNLSSSRAESDKTDKISIKSEISNIGSRSSSRIKLENDKKSLESTKASSENDNSSVIIISNSDRRGLGRVGRPPGSLNKDKITRNEKEEIKQGVIMRDSTNGGGGCRKLSRRSTANRFLLSKLCENIQT